MTGDGNLDLIVPNQTSNNVSVAVGKGDGTFTAPVSSVVPGANRPQWAAISDANNDGSPDLVVVNNGNGANTSNIAVLIGNKAATFAGTGTSAFGLTRATAFSVLGVDLNADTRTDAVVVHRVDLTQNPISVLVNGNKTAAPFYNISVTTSGGGLTTVADAGDFDGDGKVDLAVANTGANSVSILKGDGAGLLTPVAQASGTAVGSGTGDPSGIAVGDLDGDGNLDVVTANFNSIGTTGDLSVYLGDGTGRLGAAKRLSVGVSRKPQSVVLADARANYAAPRSCEPPLQRGGHDGCDLSPVVAPRRLWHQGRARAPRSEIDRRARLHIQGVAGGEVHVLAADEVAVVADLGAGAARAGVGRRRRVGRGLAAQARGGRELRRTIRAVGQVLDGETDLDELPAVADEGVQEVHALRGQELVFGRGARADAGEAQRALEAERRLHGQARGDREARRQRHRVGVARVLRELGVVPGHVHIRE